MAQTWLRAAGPRARSCVTLSGQHFSSPQGAGWPWGFFPPGGPDLHGERSDISHPSWLLSVNPLPRTSDLVPGPSQGEGRAFSATRRAARLPASPPEPRREHYWGWRGSLAGSLLLTKGPFSRPGAMTNAAAAPAAGPRCRPVSQALRLGKLQAQGKVCVGFWLCLLTRCQTASGFKTPSLLSGFSV